MDFASLGEIVGKDMRLKNVKTKMLVIQKIVQKDILNSVIFFYNW